MDDHLVHESRSDVVAILGVVPLQAAEGNKQTHGLLRVTDEFPSLAKHTEVIIAEIQADMMPLHLRSEALADVVIRRHDCLVGTTALRALISEHIMELVNTCHEALHSH